MGCLSLTIGIFDMVLFPKLQVGSFRCSGYHPPRNLDAIAVNKPRLMHACNIESCQMR